MRVLPQDYAASEGENEIHTFTLEFTYQLTIIQKKKL